jgi:hypothetical protein
MEAWRLKIEPWKVCWPVIKDSHHLDDQDPYWSEKLDPDSHYSENPDPHYSDTETKLCCLDTFKSYSLSVTYSYDSVTSMSYPVSRRMWYSGLDSCPTFELEMIRRLKKCLYLIVTDYYSVS